mmetsp:Transcript_4769/g.13708  ORF Transcript_4769/g.13708 Transcript_4769/m.13708 type:complete len:259 (+) Transcript_4769:3629-4405(+)
MEGSGNVSYLRPENHPSTTVMRFSVSVPVLSEQMADAPPMVSQAASTRTKLLSFIIFFMEKAREMVTAKGRPSGTATTRMVTAKMKNCSGPSENLEMGKPRFSTIHLIMRTTKQSSATAKPTLPMAPASTVSFSCRGVSAASPTTSAMVWPHSLCTPTADTSILPSPSVTWVPQRMKGRSSFLRSGSDSPVRDASSTTKPCPLMYNPSAVTLSPVSSSSTSPTTSSSLPTNCSTPLRSTFTSMTSFCALSLRNCRSFW